jgi:antitoxin HicB
MRLKSRGSFTVRKTGRVEKSIGSGIDDFLRAEGIFEETQAQAVKEVVAWQLAEATKRQNISKNKLAAPTAQSRE